MTSPIDSQVEKITGVLKAVAHDVRLRLLRTLLEKGEKSVSELGALTGIGQPGLSQQLGILRKAGLVQTRQDAKLVFYSLAPEALRGTAELLCALAGITSQEVRPEEKGAHSRARESAATFARIL